MRTVEQGKRLYNTIYRRIACRNCNTELLTESSDLQVLGDKYRFKCPYCGSYNVMSMIEFNQKSLDCKLDGSRI